MPTPTYAPEVAATRRAELIALTAAYVQAGELAPDNAVAKAIRTLDAIDRIEAAQ